MKKLFLILSAFLTFFLVTPVSQSLAASFTVTNQHYDAGTNTLSFDASGVPTIAPGGLNSVGIRVFNVDLQAYHLSEAPNDWADHQSVVLEVANGILPPSNDSTLYQVQIYSVNGSDYSQSFTGSSLYAAITPTPEITPGLTPGTPPTMDQEVLGATQGIVTGIQTSMISNFINVMKYAGMIILMVLVVSWVLFNFILLVTGKKKRHR